MSAVHGGHLSSVCRVEPAYSPFSRYPVCLVFILS